MSWIQEFSRAEAETQADTELRELFLRVLDLETGQLDNIMTVHSLHPNGLRAHFELYQAVMRGTPGLRKLERELLALVVSQINQCHY